MLIDNSMANCFRTCPLKFFEEYVAKFQPDSKETGIELKPKEVYSSLDFGTRWHEVMYEHYTNKHLYTKSPDEKLEEEIQWCYSAYQKQYPSEDFEVIGAEYTLNVPLPDSHHVYLMKGDLLTRNLNKRLELYDHKSQTRSSRANDPKKWAAKDQGTLYLWGAECIFGEPIEAMYINILTRPSPSGLIGPTFPERYRIERTSEQKDLAVRDIIYVADQIEACYKRYGTTHVWPANRENCIQYGECEFYLPHTYGWSENILLAKYQEKKPYLELGGVPIFQDVPK